MSANVNAGICTVYVDDDLIDEGDEEAIKDHIRATIKWHLFAQKCANEVAAEYAEDEEFIRSVSKELFGIDTIIKKEIRREIRKLKIAEMRQRNAPKEDS